MVRALARTAGSSKQPIEQSDATSGAVYHSRKGEGGLDRPRLVALVYHSGRECGKNLPWAVGEEEEMLGEFLLPCRL
jgi:hypothetical protein